MRAPISTMRLLPLLGGLLIAFASAAAPAVSDPRRALQDAERANTDEQAAHRDAVDRAARAATEAMRLAHERIEATARLRQAEAATAEAAARIDVLAVRRREAERRVQARAAALQPLLPLIQRLSLYPAETLLAVPAPPDEALRGVLVLQGLARQMEQEAEALRRDQAALDAATGALQQEAPRLANAEAEQKTEAEVLDQKIAAALDDQTAAEVAASQAATRAALAASRMESLRSALASIEAQRKADEARAREQAQRAEKEKHAAAAAEARGRESMAAHPSGAGTIAAGAAPHGQLQPPVIGVVIRGWGEQTDGGPATGLSYHAPPGARVTSPCGGRVVFAEPFRSYGLLLIVDCGGGYHIVLAGFDRLDVRPGQNVLAGEPVGVMPNWVPGSTAKRPALYIELRRDGTPVNPAQWLRPAG